MGARFPSRISSAWTSPRAVAECAGVCLHRNRDRARAQRHRGAIASARCRDPHRQLQPAEPVLRGAAEDAADLRSEEHTSELQSLMRISYSVFCLKKTNTITHTN